MKLILYECDTRTHILSHTNIKKHTNTEIYAKYIYHNQARHQTNFFQILIATEVTPQTQLSLWDQDILVNGKRSMGWTKHL